MLFSELQNLNDQIVTLLVTGKSSVRLIHARLRKTEQISLRAVYKSVNKLIHEGVVLKVGQHVMLNQEWVARVNDGLRISAPFTLTTGEKIVYILHSVEHLDTVWKTIILPMEKSDTYNETFFYNPHDFWAYLPSRKTSEHTYYRSFSKNQRFGYFTIGGTLRADKEFKREYQSHNLQVHLKEIPAFRRTDHITIIDNYVITARLPILTTNKIEALYGTNQAIAHILPKIIEISRNPGKIQLIVENNPHKAARIMKTLSKNFYIKERRKDIA